MHDSNLKRVLNCKWPIRTEQLKPNKAPRGLCRTVLTILACCCCSHYSCLRNRSVAATAQTSEQLRVSASLPRQTSYLWKRQVCQRWHRNAFISVFGKGFGFKHNRYMLARCPHPPNIIVYIFQFFCSALLILRESLAFLKIQHSTHTVWTPENRLATVPLWSQGGYKHTSHLIM